MKIRQSLRIAWRSITAHKLRSTLTTLGVILGIAAVIMFMVLGGGFTQDFVGGLEEYDEPAMLVWTQTTPPDGFGIMPVESPIYTEHDVEELQAIDGVAFAAPMGEVPASQVSIGDEQLTAPPVAVAASTGEGFEYDEFVAGEAFSDGENEAVVNTVATQFLETELEVGDEVDVSHPDGTTSTLTVTGIIEEAEELGTEPTIYVPTDPFYNTTVETPRGTTEPAYSEIVVGAEDMEVLADVQTDVESYLEDDSDAAELKQDDDEIAVQTVQDAIDQFSEVIDQLTVFIAAVAGIALVVGSIGIANIMIVSVTERTREIGIMKAVGARQRDIMQLFLVESIILGLLGALIGVLAGLGFGYLGVTYLGWPMAYPVDWLVLAVVIGVGVGVLSGLYPAWRAARVDPIEALRHE